MERIIYQKLSKKREGMKCSWQNGKNRLGRRRMITKFKFVKKEQLQIANKVKRYKTRFVCIKTNHIQVKIDIR